jgi:hypothetical protein
MALCYAETFPQHTADVILQGVYLGSPQEHAPLFRVGFTAATASGLGHITTSRMQPAAERHAAYREAFSILSTQVELAIASSSSPPSTTDGATWVEDPLRLHTLYRDYVMSFVPLQRQALDAFASSDTAVAGSADVEAAAIGTRKKLLLSQTVAIFPIEGKRYATFSVPDDGRPCLCAQQDAAKASSSSSSSGSRRLCCIEHAHRALAIWSLYENFITYPHRAAALPCQNESGRGHDAPIPCESQGYHRRPHAIVSLPVHDVERGRGRRRCEGRQCGGTAACCCQ